MEKLLVEKFISDPNWHIMEDYIASFFEKTTSIQDINTDLDSQTVHAELIARKRIDEDLQKLLISFKQAKQLGDKPTKPNYE